jgi:HlyD family secretion protein
VALLRLAPSAIDNVSVGRPAEVRLSAYRRVDAPILAGEVIFVSADLLEDPQAEEGYFEVRVALDPDDVAALTDAQIVAGMPVEVTITIGARRAGDYLLEPILRHMRHALNEE